MSGWVLTKNLFIQPIFGQKLLQVPKMAILDGYDVILYEVISYE